jgi:hypothetical protein
MTRLIPSSLGVVVAVVFAQASARADVGPPPDYKDGCVALGVSRDAPGCVVCGVPEFKDQACHTRAAADGLAERCRGWSYAMYCNGAEPAPVPAPVPPAETGPTAPAKKGCAGGTSELAGAILALGAFVGVRPTRRRR